MDRALGEVASLGIAEQALDKLGMTALTFSMDYGKSATDFVRASYEIQSAIAGLEGYELSTFTKASGVLAAATKADTGTITSFMGSMYSIFEKQANAIGRAQWVEDLAGKTATAVQIFKTTGKGMADAFEAIGAAGNIAGVSMDEQFAVLGMLQSTMGGGEAGTKFSAFLSGIGNAQKVLGMNFKNSAGQVMPVLDILEQLKLRYGETMTIAQGDELKKAFGSDEAVAMIKLLMTNTKALGSNINALANTHGMGKAEQMAASMTDQWQRLEAVWFAIRASAFGQLTPAINDVISHIVDVGGVMLRWTKLFPNLTKAVSTVVLAVAGFAALGGVMTILSALGGLFAAIAWPVLLVGAAIGALVLWWDPIKAFAQGLISTLGPAISQVFEPWAEILPVIWDGISSVISKIGEFFGATNEATGAFSNMTEMGKSAGTILGSIFKVLYSPIWAIGKAIKWVLEMFEKLPGVKIDVGSVPELSMPEFTMPTMTPLTMPVIPQELSMPEFTIPTMTPLTMPAIPQVLSMPEFTVPTMTPLTMPVIPQVLSMPTPERQLETVNASLASYRQGEQNSIPSGGLGKQLILANAAATTANQKPSKALHIGEVHMHNQNPMTPEQMAESAWLETP
ncbi:phage tail tape measure protein [Aeromonas salmonicida]|nr:phage tail tape measure protein [Aeromonas salmonicida]